MTKSPRGRSFDVIASDMVRADPLLAREFLAEAAQALLANEPDVARHLIRQAITGGIGYAALSRRTGIPDKSLGRMFGPKGNPTLTNLFTVLAELQRHADIRLEVRGVSAAARRPARRAA